MSYLLDTHAFLWYIEGNLKLPNTSKEIIENSAIKKVVSIVSLWEIVIKTSRGKLTLTIPLENLIEYIKVNKFELLPIEFSHLVELNNLMYYHADPFDRLMIAQARAEGLTVISADRHFASYPINVVW